MIVTMFFTWCNYFNYILLNYCVAELSEETGKNFGQDTGKSRFQVHYQWTHLNFTWASPEHYEWAIQTKYYIPENNVPVGMKFYKNRMFLSVPRYRGGVPATLVYLDYNSETNSQNPPLSPFPDWFTNNDVSCSNLQSVQSMEIDTKGILWVIDGTRINNYTRCPTKLVLFDLNSAGTVVHTYTFPNEICLQNGGFLNDLVVDESDGDFAYITDNSAIDPGIIVYSRSKDHSWKLRDVSMFPEPNANNFLVEDMVFDAMVLVDGIALSPKRKNNEKTLFFCALTAYTLYSITTSVVKNEELVKTGHWRANVRNHGQKISQTDGIIIDEKSKMYLTMLPLYGVAKWNINKPLWMSKVIDKNRNSLIWPDGFAFDQNGYLYVISNKVYNYIDPRRTPVINGKIQFRVLRIYTGTRSYLYG